MSLTNNESERKGVWMMVKKKEPDAVFKVSGREFRLYKYYDDAVQQEMLNYPNFDESPEYTDEGRPFKLMVQESCEYGKDENDPDDPDPGDCGGCVFFKREHTAYDPIGVCMCEELKTENGKRKIENG